MNVQRDRTRDNNRSLCHWLTSTRLVQRTPMLAVGCRIGLPARLCVRTWLSRENDPGRSIAFDGEEVCPYRERRGFRSKWQGRGVAIWFSSLIYRFLFSSNITRVATHRLEERNRTLERETYLRNVHHQTVQYSYGLNTYLQMDGLPNAQPGPCLKWRGWEARQGHHARTYVHVIFSSI